MQSVVTLEVKPWDDETDLKALEKSVRSVEQEGLVWGSSKFVAVGYGIKKLQITLVIEDELVSLDELQEKIAEFEDYVQSTDVAAMQSEFPPTSTASADMLMQRVLIRAVSIHDSRKYVLYREPYATSITTLPFACLVISLLYALYTSPNLYTESMTGLTLR